MKKGTTALFLMTALNVGLCACQSDSKNESGIGELPEAEPIRLRLAEKVAADNTFALDLFRTACRFAKPAENVFVSPVSVSMALNMAANGANGVTRDEMFAALRERDYTMEEVNEYSRSLRTALMEVDPSTAFSIANSIWYRQGFPVKAPFIDVNRENYDAEVNEIDFASPDALRQINGWCARKTRDKITEIVEQINGNVMILINAVYFKGVWRSKFKEKDTEKADFHLPDGSVRKVDMMRQTASFSYTADEYAGYLELPYGNQAFSMMVILPHEGRTPDEVTARLDREYWNERMSLLARQPVNLRLPRFKTENKYLLHTDILPDMGMKAPFSPEADFGGISDHPLNISSVIHKTYVEVNEEGTEAAAVTAVNMITSAGGPPPSPIDFRVDRPFLIALCEKSTGIILFMGRMEAV
ncbi:MAG: serpin family protein [Tannerella sp.]|nr:serpin family protein [Tannerella sp.]